MELWTKDSMPFEIDSEPHELHEMAAGETEPRVPRRSNIIGLQKRYCGLQPGQTQRLLLLPALFGLAGCVVVSSITIDDITLAHPISACATSNPWIILLGLVPILITLPFASVLLGASHIAQEVAEMGLEKSEDVVRELTVRGSRFRVVELLQWSLLVAVYSYIAIAEYVCMKDHDVDTSVSGLLPLNSRRGGSNCTRARHLCTLVVHARSPLPQ